MKLAKVWPETWLNQSLKRINLSVVGRKRTSPVTSPVTNLATELLHMLSKWYARDYVTARDSFRKNAANANGELFALPLNELGTQGEELSIDIAWLGSKQPSHVMLHLSGVHGVEGFVGSAIQCQLLSNSPPIPDNHAIVFVHAINPWGMAWLRRFNESNVDLNRNFLASDEQYVGAPDGYAQLDALLNPKSVPGWFDLFFVRCLFSIMQHGFASLKQTVACGQYEYPEGLFFGGKQLEASACLLVEWIRDNLSCAERIFTIDIHSGLGKFSEAALLVSCDRSSQECTVLVDRFGKQVQPLSKEGVAYSIRGMFMDGLTAVLPDAHWTSMGQEFGTYSPLRVLKALRDENWFHHYGENVTVDHVLSKNSSDVKLERS